MGLFFQGDSAGGAPAKPDKTDRPLLTNRRQKLLFVVLTLVLTAVTVWATRVWTQRTDTLVFAVAEPGGFEAQFATKLTAMLKENGSKLRIKIVTNADNAKAAALMDRREADLAILRSDTRIPARARAIAILEHDLLLLVSPGEKKIDSLATLRKKKIAVMGDGVANDVFVRKLLEISEGSEAAARVQLAPPTATLDNLLSAGKYGAVVIVAHTTKIATDKGYAQAAKRPGGFTVNKIDETIALARKFPFVFEEKIGTGMLSSSPQVPDDDLDTVGLEWVLAARSQLSEGVGVELTRLIYENKAELALDGFASKIEAADADKAAFIVAHRGTAAYLSDTTKSFMERYSDVMYLGAGVLSVIGSLFVGLYTAVTRVAPEKASQLATDILDIGERIQHAHSLDELEAMQDELEAILRNAVIGLRDGTISSDGLDTFRLGYELVRDEIAMRRHSLQRRGDYEDNVVSVKAAQGS